MGNDERPAPAALQEEHGRLLTPGEASRMTGIGVKALSGRADRGTLACFRLGPGTHRRYREADILALADASLMTPGEAGEALRIQAKTITRWADEGRIWSEKTPGGHRRVRRDQIMAIAAGKEIPWDES